MRLVFQGRFERPSTQWTRQGFSQGVSSAFTCFGSLGQGSGFCAVFALGNVWRGNASEIKRCRGRQLSVHSWSRSVSRLDSSVHPHVHTSTHVHPHIRSHRSTSHPFIHTYFRGVHDVRMVFEEWGVTTSFPRCRSERVCVLKEFLLNLVQRFGALSELFSLLEMKSGSCDTTGNQRNAVFRQKLRQKLFQCIICDVAEFTK